MSERHPGYESPAGPPMDALDRALLDEFNALLDALTDDQFAAWMDRRSKGYMRVADQVIALRAAAVPPTDGETR